MKSLFFAALMAALLGPTGCMRQTDERTAQRGERTINYFRVRNRNGYDLCFAEFRGWEKAGVLVTYIPCREIDPPLIFDTGASQSR